MNSNALMISVIELSESISNKKNRYDYLIFEPKNLISSPQNLHHLFPITLTNGDHALSYLDLIPFDIFNFILIDNVGFMRP